MYFPADSWLVQFVFSYRSQFYYVFFDVLQRVKIVGSSEVFRDDVLLVDLCLLDERGRSLYRIGGPVGEPLAICYRVRWDRNAVLRSPVLGFGSMNDGPEP
jgi:hypothetical protein